MTAFILDLGKTNQIDLSNEAFIDVVLNYANFLKKPLTLGMFIPVDEDDNVLFEFQDEFLSWDNTDMENQNIEDLLSDDLTYTLTPYALKQIGL